MFLLLENVVHTYLCIKRHRSCKGYKWRLKCKYDNYQITNYAIFLPHLQFQSVKIRQKDHKYPRNEKKVYIIKYVP